MKKYTHEEWAAEGTRRFGNFVETWKFVCPSCGCIASARDWALLAVPNAIAFSCIGRYNGKGKDKNTFSKNGGPCTYAGGGLIQMNPVRVSMPDGTTLHLFDFAPGIANNPPDQKPD